MKILKIFVASILILLTLILFISVSASSFGGHGHCLTPLMSDGNCPPINNLVATVNHHLAGLKDIGKTIINSAPVLNIILILAVSSVFAIIAFLLHPRRLLCYANRLTQFILLDSIIQQVRKNIFWIVFHNKGVALDIFWMRE